MQYTFCTSTLENISRSLWPGTRSHASGVRLHVPHSVNKCTQTRIEIDHCFNYINACLNWADGIQVLKASDLIKLMHGRTRFTIPTWISCPVVGESQSHLGIKLGGKGHEQLNMLRTLWADSPHIWKKKHKTNPKQTYELMDPFLNVMGGIWQCH